MDYLYCYDNDNILQNVTVQNLYSSSGTTLSGDLTVTGSFSGGINANGNTITLDLTNRKITDGSIISSFANIIGNPQYKLLLRDDMAPGRYHLASEVDALTGSFDICVTSNPGIPIATLNSDNMSFIPGEEDEHQNWEYRLEYDSSFQQLDLCYSKYSGEQYFYKRCHTICWKIKKSADASNQF